VGSNPTEYILFSFFYFLNKYLLRHFFLILFDNKRYGKKIPINVINAIPIPKSGAGSSQAILTELNEVSSFQISTIHYLEVSDTFQLPIPSSLKAAIEKVCIPEDDVMNGV
jgi:hypothetical protein